MKHPLDVEKYKGNLEELAKDIGKMRYDKARDLLGHLGDDIKRQADADAKKGRKKLAKELYKTADELYEARDAMGKAWKVCEPYM